MIATQKDKLFLKNQLYLQQYCIGPNGQYYTGKTFNPLYSKKLTKTSQSSYIIINQYTQTLPIVTQSDYDKGYILRYFAINKLSKIVTIIQIDKYQYENISLGIFNKIKIFWYVSGQKKEVYDKNLQTIKLNDMLKYKLNNCLQFYKQINYTSKQSVTQLNMYNKYQIYNYYSSIGFSLIPQNHNQQGCTLYNFIHKNYNIIDFIDTQVCVKTGIKLNGKQFCLIGIQTDIYTSIITDKLFLLCKSKPIYYGNIILLYINSQYVQSFPYLINYKSDLKIYGKGQILRFTEIFNNIQFVQIIQLSDLIKMLQQLQQQVNDIQIVKN